MSNNSGPGYKQRPDHRITITPAGMRVQVRFDGEVIADSANALRMDEGNYAPVYYIPRKDANMARFVRTTHTSYCPFKGRAAYYTLASARRSEENAVWSYEQPYDEVAVIGEHLAFYPDKVESITVSA